MKYNASLYSREPLQIIENIPVFTDIDRYVENYEKIAQDHIAAMTGDSANPFIADKIWQALEHSTRDLVNAYIAPGSRVLDVGVGMGRVLAPFESLERYGVDISIEYLRMAKKAGFNVAYAKIEDMPYIDGFFDAAIACDVLEHVIDLHRCCEQIVRVVKTGGLVMVRVPNRDNLEPYVDPSLPYDFVHLRSFDLYGLRVLFEKIYGCEYVEHRHVAPHFKGAHTLNVQTLSASSALRARLLETPRTGHPLSPLKMFTRLTDEQLNNTVGVLRDQHPELYAEIETDLLVPLEVNVVFRKMKPSVTAGG